MLLIAQGDTIVERQVNLLGGLRETLCGSQRSKLSKTGSGEQLLTWAGKPTRRLAPLTTSNTLVVHLPHFIVERSRPGPQQILIL